MTPAPEAAAPELDERTITIVVDNVSDTLSSIAPGVPQLPGMAYVLRGCPADRLRTRWRRRCRRRMAE